MNFIPFFSLLLFSASIFEQFIAERILTESEKADSLASQSQALTAFGVLQDKFPTTCRVMKIFEGKIEKETDLCDMLIKSLTAEIQIPLHDFIASSEEIRLRLLSEYDTIHTEVSRSTETYMKNVRTFLQQFENYREAITFSNNPRKDKHNHQRSFSFLSALFGVTEDATICVNSINERRCAVRIQHTELEYLLRQAAIKMQSLAWKIEWHQEKFLTQINDYIRKLVVIESSIQASSQYDLQYLFREVEKKNAPMMDIDTIVRKAGVDKEEMNIRSCRADFLFSCLEGDDKKLLAHRPTATCVTAKNARKAKPLERSPLSLNMVGLGEAMISPDELISQDVRTNMQLIISKRLTRKDDEQKPKRQNNIT